MHVSAATCRNLEQVHAGISNKLSHSLIGQLLAVSPAGPRSLRKGRQRSESCRSTVYVARRWYTAVNFCVSRANDTNPTWNNMSAETRRAPATI